MEGDYNVRIKGPRNGGKYKYVMYIRDENENLLCMRNLKEKPDDTYIDKLIDYERRKKFNLNSRTNM
jgi:hypothetical protein